LCHDELELSLRKRGKLPHKIPQYYRASKFDSKKGIIATKISFPHNTACGWLQLRTTGAMTQPRACLVAGFQLHQRRHDKMNVQFLGNGAPAVVGIDVPSGQLCEGEQGRQWTQTSGLKTE
jgi:hypothetical protein